MYQTKQFEQTDTDAIHALLIARPLGSLVTLGPDGLSANPVPFELLTTAKPYGVLRGHVARSNPVWRELADDARALVIFQGADAYVSPTWYPSKKVHRKAVPTWNYVAAHTHGRARIVNDEQWLRAHLERMTQQHESTQAEPWSIDDAPAAYIDKMLTAIIGIEIQITRLEGKWKVSQNRPAEDREGVSRALRMQATTGALQMADCIDDAKP